MPNNLDAKLEEFEVKLEELISPLHFSLLINEVEEGRSIFITRHGHRVAIATPLPPQIENGELMQEWVTSLKKSEKIEIEVKNLELLLKN